MELFFINLAFMALLCVLEVRPVTLDSRQERLDPKSLMALGIAYLCFLGMFRGAACGNDTSNYHELYLRIASQSGLLYSIRNTSFEPLFAALIYLLSRLTHNPQILFIVTALFSFAVTGRFMSKYSSRPCFSLYLFFTLQLFDFYISGVRQALAISILLLAYEAMDNKKPIQMVLLIMLAGLFHRSALIWLPVYFLLRIPRRKTFVWVTVAACAVAFVCSKYLVTIIATAIPRYQFYLGSSYLKSGFKLSLLLYFLVFGLVLLVCEFFRGKEDTPEQDERDEWDFRLSFLLPVVCVLGYTAPIFSRFLQYFQPYLCVYFANRLARMPEKFRRFLLIASLICFAAYAATIQILRTPQWYTTYPFVFCWDS